MSSYSCWPTTDSEPGNAWRAATEMAKRHEVCVLTKGGGEEQKWIEDQLAAHPIPSLRFVYVQAASSLRNKLGKSWGINLHYLIWQKKAEGVARALHQEIGFDLSHHVTFGRYWTPSAVANLGIPFVWGPIGAAEVTPFRFLRDLPWSDKIEEIIRTGIKRLWEWNPDLWRTARNSTVAVAVTKDTRERLKKLGAKKIMLHPQFTMSDEQLAYRKGFPTPNWRPFRVIQVGRMVLWKGAHLTLRAFAEFARGKNDVALAFAGSGPARAHLEALTDQLDLREKVTFHGQLPTQDDLAAKVAESHVVMHPALHEAFGNVCLEGIAMGKPLVCLDIGGPASICTPESGFAVPAIDPDQAVKAMAAALEQLYRDEALYHRMSQAAFQRAASEYRTENAVEWMNGIYEQVKA